MFIESFFKSVSVVTCSAVDHRVMLSFLPHRFKTDEAGTRTRLAGISITKLCRVKKVASVSSQAWNCGTAAGKSNSTADYSRIKSCSYLSCYRNQRFNYM